MGTIGTPKQIAVTAARSAFGAVPWIGSALNEVLFEHRSRIKQQRFEEFVAGMEADLSRLDESAINKDYLHSEEFSDLLESVVVRVVQSGDSARRARLREFLVAQMRAPAPASDQELFLDIAAEITEKELEILQAYAEASKRPRAEDEPIEQPKKGAFREAWNYGLEERQYLFHVQKLISRGLMYDDGLGRWSTPAMKFFEISELGLAFLSYVTSGAG
jgi:hypothetical protein